MRLLNLMVVFFPRLCINGVTNQRTQRLGLAWPWGIIIQWTNFLSRGFDLIVESNDIQLVYFTINQPRIIGSAIRFSVYPTAL
jgi:hypothetical protein